MSDHEQRIILLERRVSALHLALIGRCPRYGLKSERLRQRCKNASLKEPRT